MSVELMFGTLTQLLTSPYTMWMLLLGTGIGIFFGAVPGLGGRLAIAATIPFIFGKEMIPGAVFLLSMHAVTGTSGQISSILFGVPGTGDDAATIVDGYPMAKKGEAGIALGASLMASGIGGVIGACVLAVLIPVIEPIVLNFSPAEFFFLALLGITFVAFISGSAIFKGIVVGFYGMMLSFIGMEAQTGIPRYSEEFLFLWDGLDLITAVLALFAVPEMIHLGVCDPAGHYRDGSLAFASGPEGIDQRDVRHPAVELTVVEAADLLNGLPDLFGRDDDDGAFVRLHLRASHA